MSHTPAYRRPPTRCLGCACGVRYVPWRGVSGWSTPPQYAHGDQHVRSLDIHLLAHTDIDFPGRVHSSNWPMKSSIEPAFSDDHMFIDEYGSEYTSTFLPRSPCASRTIKHFVVKIAESRKVAYAATGCSPGTMRLATSCGIGISCWNIQLVRDANSVM